MKQKLKALWLIINSDSFHTFTQKTSGEKIKVTAQGRGDIGDMILVSVALKEAYNNFVDVITEAAVEGGEVHALQEVKKAIGVLEKEK